MAILRKHAHAHNRRTSSDDIYMDLAIDRTDASFIWWILHCLDVRVYMEESFPTRYNRIYHFVYDPQIDCQYLNTWNKLMIYFESIYNLNTCNLKILRSGMTNDYPWHNQDSRISSSFIVLVDENIL